MQEKTAHIMLGAFILVGLLIGVGITLLIAGNTLPASLLP